MTGTPSASAAAIAPAGSSVPATAGAGEAAVGAGRSSSVAAALAGHGGRRLLGFVVPVTLALVLEGIIAAGLYNGRLLPPPSAVLATLWQLAATGELFEHIAITLWRVAVGFLFGTLAGTALGALTGSFSLARALLDPMLQALRAIPSIAWVPLFILWFGIFEASKVTLIAVGVFFPVYLTTAAAILDVDRKLVEVGRIYRLSPLQLIRRVLLPAILPSYVVALRTGLGLGWMFVVAAEFMGASKGLGYLLTDGQMTGNPTIILASIVTFAVLGKLTDGLLATVTRPVLRWQDSLGNSRR